LCNSAAIASKAGHTAASEPGGNHTATEAQSSVTQNSANGRIACSRISSKPRQRRLSWSSAAVVQFVHS
jgi:threonine aldolase